MDTTHRKPLAWVGFAALMLAALACTCGPLSNLTGQVESQLQVATPTSAIMFSTAAVNQTDDSGNDSSGGDSGGATTGGMQGDYTGEVFDGNDGYDTTVSQWYTGLTTGTFASLLDAHNYVFEAQSGDSVRIEVRGTDGVDTRLKVIDPAGNVLEEVDDLDGTTDPTVQIDSLPASGVYTARIDTWDEGSYEIGIYLNGEPPASSGGGQATTGGTTQWAVSATASSQYGDPSWSPSQATSAPDTVSCGDESTAWASETSNGNDWLRLVYAQAVIPTQIQIYETYNPGAIVQVDVVNSQTAYIATVYFDYGQKPTPECPRVMNIDVSGVDEPVDTVVVYLDQTNHTGWNEIDAVSLISQ